MPLQAADQLVHHVAECAGVGNPTLDAFGHELACRRTDLGLRRRIPVGAEPCIAPMEPMPR